jgi:glycosyltransferase involved in cell wall biosynthesis
LRVIGTLDPFRACPSRAPHTLMKILHYIEQLDLKSGGPVRAVLDLSRLTAEAGHSVTIISPTVNDAPKEWLTPPAAGERRPHVIEVPAFSLPGSLFPFPVVEKIKSDLISRHDLLHVHGMWAPSNVQLTAAAYRIGVPYIISLRGMLDDWPMSQRHLKKRLYLAIAGRRSLHRASFVHCTAEGEHDQSRKWFPRGRGRVIPNLLDLQPFRDAPGPELARRKFASVGLDGSTPAVLFLSRVHYKKGIEHFIKAAGILRDRGVSCRWYIAGDGDERYIDSLKALSSSLNLGDRVHFLGMVKGVEKISLYQSADLFVLPTSQENFGFVVVEAMAAGVPVVTTKGMDLWPELEACGDGRGTAARRGATQGDGREGASVGVQQPERRGGDRAVRRDVRRRDQRTHGRDDRATARRVLAGGSRGEFHRAGPRAAG